MKKIKLMPLLVVLCMLMGNTIYAQNVSQNTITRYPCNSSYQGCVGNTVVLKLSGVGSNTNSYEAGYEFFKYLGLNKKITVTLKVPGGSDYTSTLPYYLPTVIGESTIIHLGADGEGVGPFIIGIYKNADKEFTLSVGNTAY